MVDPAEQRIRSAVGKAVRAKGAGYRALAARYDVSIGALHKFVHGGRLTETIWDALYREHDDLRWSLEEYRRQRAIGSGTRQPRGEPVATGPPPRSPGR
jgi:hypothetical protein